MPIRKKLTIASICVFLIPIVGCIIIASLFMHGFESKFGAENDYTQLQALEIYFADGNTEQFDMICRSLEQNGYYIQANNNIINYQTDGFEEMYGQVAGVQVSRDDTLQLNISNAHGSVYLKNSTDESQGMFAVISDNPNGTTYSRAILSDLGPNYIRSTMIWIISAIAGLVTVVISVSVYIMSRSILKPLKLIQEGTHQIRKGNLNHKIEYTKKDEFGAVCGDFEDMRRSLLELNEEEKRYENNRKELIAGITHDLNTPLTSIKGFASGLLEGIVNTPEKTKGYLENIKLTADRMGLMISELLLYSTLDMEGIAFSYERIDMNEYFKDCCRDVQEDLLKNSMSVRFHSECENAYADIDLMQFRRVVLNVLENSAKYKRNGHGNIDISISKSDKSIILSLKDDGLGIPPEEADKVFQVLYREDKSRSQTGGSGLGLAIVQRIISAHGGTVQINKEYTQGLEIIIELPAAPCSGRDTIANQPQPTE